MKLVAEGLSRRSYLEDQIRQCDRDRFLDTTRFDAGWRFKDHRAALASRLPPMDSSVRNYLAVAPIICHSCKEVFHTLVSRPCRITLIFPAPSFMFLSSGTWMPFVRNRMSERPGIGSGGDRSNTSWRVNGRRLPGVRGPPRGSPLTLRSQLLRRRPLPNRRRVLTLGTNTMHSSARSLANRPVRTTPATWIDGTGGSS